MAGVEQRRQQDDRRPGQPARDVADGRELGGAREHDACSSPWPRSGEKPGLARGQPVDEPEADRRRPRSPAPRRSAAGDSPGRRRGGVAGAPASRRVGSAQEGLAAGPVADDEDARASRPRSPQRGAGPGSPSSGTSRPTSARCSSSGVVSAASVAARSVARGDERRDASPRDPPRSRSCTGSSGRRSRSPGLRGCQERTGGGVV